LVILRKPLCSQSAAGSGVLVDASLIGIPDDRAISARVGLASEPNTLVDEISETVSFTLSRGGEVFCPLDDSEPICPA
jgi:hypothetical protein